MHVALLHDTNRARVSRRDSPRYRQCVVMAKNEKSSKELASLAGKVLQQKSSTEAAKKLAGSVLTQTADKKTSPSKKGR